MATTTKGLSGPAIDAEDERVVYIPSPETIAIECAAIRANWPKGEHRLRNVVERAVLDAKRWTPPKVRTGLRGEV